MWDHKWSALVQHVPAFGPWLVLLLGCLLGIVAVVALRSARKTAFFVSTLILLIPLAALADFPHPKFLDGPIAHGYQVSDDLKAVVPRAGEITAGVSMPSLSGLGNVSVFSTSTVTAPAFSALQCIVTAQPVLRAGGPGNKLFWQIAMRIGTTVTLEPGQISLPGNPLPLSIEWSPDFFYSATSVEKFIIPAGQTAAFGAKVFNGGNNILFPVFSVKEVYSCSITPPPWTSGP